MGRHQPLPICRTSTLKTQEWRAIALLEGGKNGLKPGRNLGMITARVVIKKTGFGNES